MRPHLVLQAEQISHEIRALYADTPEMQDDPLLQLDMLEGETDLFEFLDDIVGNLLEQRSMHAAIKDRIAILQERGERYERREDFCRKLAMRLLEAADLRKIALTEATLNIQPSPPAVMIADPDALPTDYWRIKREPNLARIKEHLRAGQPVPGASLSNRQDTLYVRTK